MQKMVGVLEMITALLPIIGTALDKLLGLIPDPNARAKAQETFMKEVMDAANAQAQQQSEVNKIEAQHASVFVAGWRPFIGWICGFALAYHFIIQPFLAFIFAVYGLDYTLPVFDMDALMTVLLGMLGLGAMRTVEKINGVTTGLAPKVKK